MTHKRSAAGFSQSLEQLSEMVCNWTGSSTAFAMAMAVVIVWAAVGPLFDFSNTWQLVINTGTTIVTFLMVFLIQRSQNKSSLAMQLKLNELVAALQGASNRLIDVESMTERELDVLHRYYGELATLSAKQGAVTDTHSVEEARQRHQRKARKIPDVAGGEA
jgi:low affinity Fe/Cu permease